MVFAGDGASVVTAKFRLVVWKPHRNQVLVGRVKETNERGIIVTMGFFDHIFIPRQNLPVDSELYVSSQFVHSDFVSDLVHRTWKYQYDQDQEVTFWFEKDNQIRSVPFFFFV